LEKKVRVALDWTLDLLFSKYLVHLRKIGDAGDLGQHWLAPYAVLSMQQANLAK
jgi:hypothetical protein